MYGAKFADHWGGLEQRIVRAVWAKGLASVNDEEIAGGLRAAIASGKPFPPTLPEFFAFCRPPVRVPHSSDHAGLDNLAKRIGVSTYSCPSYDALRMRIVEHLERDKPLALPTP